MDIETLRRRIVYQVPGMATTAVQRDIAYHAVATDPALRMDVYTPAELDGSDRLPAVIFIHGGPVSPDLPLRPKDWGVFVSYGTLMAASGLVGVTFNHRLYGRDLLETAAGDIVAAIDYLQKHADVLRIDKQRLGIWVFSGGGPQLGPLLRNLPASVRGIVSYYAALDLRSLLRADEQPLSEGSLQRFSPCEFLQQGGKLSVPMLIARAGCDVPVFNETVDRFLQLALANNAPIELINYPDGQHGFDIVDDTERSRDIIGRTVAFLLNQLK